eukprot:1374735-Pleurochrysis_carterae.AAC.4
MFDRDDQEAGYHSDEWELRLSPDEGYDEEGGPLNAELQSTGGQGGLGDPCDAPDAQSGDVRMTLADETELMSEYHDERLVAENRTRIRQQHMQPASAHPQPAACKGAALASDISCAAAMSERDTASSSSLVSAHPSNAAPGGVAAVAATVTTATAINADTAAVSVAVSTAVKGAGEMVVERTTAAATSSAARTTAAVITTDAATPAAVTAAAAAEANTSTSTAAASTKEITSKKLSNLRDAPVPVPSLVLNATSHPVSDEQVCHIPVELQQQSSVCERMHAGEQMNACTRVDTMPTSLHAAAQARAGADTGVLGPFACDGGGSAPLAQFARETDAQFARETDAQFARGTDAQFARGTDAPFARETVFSRENLWAKLSDCDESEDESDDDYDGVHGGVREGIGGRGNRTRGDEASWEGRAGQGHTLQAGHGETPQDGYKTTLLLGRKAGQNAEQDAEEEGKRVGNKHTEGKYTGEHNAERAAERAHFPEHNAEQFVEENAMPDNSVHLSRESARPAVQGAVLAAGPQACAAPSVDVDGVPEADVEAVRHDGAAAASDTTATLSHAAAPGAGGLASTCSRHDGKVTTKPSFVNPIQSSVMPIPSTVNPNSSVPNLDVSAANADFADSAAVAPAASGSGEGFHDNSQQHQVQCGGGDGEGRGAHSSGDGGGRGCGGGLSLIHI